MGFTSLRVVFGDEGVGIKFSCLVLKLFKGLKERPLLGVPPIVPLSYRVSGFRPVH